MKPSAATPRFLDALQFAVILHGSDARKGSCVPYFAHLMSVCAIVLVDGGSEDEAIAALLHDALEDHPLDVSREEIGQRFGPAVLASVEACTDTPPDYRGGEKPPWSERKEGYLEHLRHMAPGDLRVPLADKLDNVRATISDYREVGEPVWDKFNAGRESQLWYFRSLVDAFRTAGATGPLVDEFERVVTELESLAGT